MSTSTQISTTAAPLTDDERAELRSRLAEVGTLPWFEYFTAHGDPFVVSDRRLALMRQVCRVDTGPDDYGRATARYIAAACSAVPSLLAECDDLRRERDEARKLARHNYWCAIREQNRKTDSALEPAYPDLPEGDEYAALVSENERLRGERDSENGGRLLAERELAEVRAEIAERVRPLLLMAAGWRPSDRGGLGVLWDHRMLGPGCPDLLPLDRAWERQRRAELEGDSRDV